MKKIFKYLPLLAVALTMVACQNDDEENFDNKAYINATTMSSETIIKGESGTINKTLTIATSRPAEKEISAKAVVDKSLVAIYNKAYYADAQMLPDTCYAIAESNMTIDKGSVKSTEASFNFMKLGGLDRSIAYVLPVSIQTTDIDMIASEKTYYYVFKAGALINVVADIEKNSLQVYPWSASTLSRVQNLNQITMEALVYPRDMSKLISTVMGIEGKFLMRLGDAGIPGNQLQIATSTGNFTDAKLQIEPNKWSHLAMTYDQNTGDLKVYINGHLMVSTTVHYIIGIVGNGSDRNFMVGKSYDNTRYLTGCISEVRVWDVIRTPDEIANHIYTVDPASAGLIAYWKFDDQSSYTVKDYTGNGNDLTANAALIWKNVSLPAK